jgi:hypothetical protein
MLGAAARAVRIGEQTAMNASATMQRAFVANARRAPRRAGRVAVSLGALLVTCGCTDAVYTLGSVPSESEQRNSCLDASPAARQAAGCGGASGREAGVDVPPPRDSGADTKEAAVPETDARPACTPRFVVASRKGLNLYLLVDSSLPSLLQAPWDKIGLGIAHFVQDPAHAGIGVGIGYYGLSCSASQYARPTVAIQLLPDSTEAITNSFPLLPLSGKAGGAALQGAVMYARAVKANDSDRETAIVLMSDGLIDPLCGSNATDVANQARLGLYGTPAIKTHVLALGAGPKPLDPAALNDLSPLDDVAAAGGTLAASRVYVTSNADREVAAGLEVAVANATPCEYRLPEGMDAARLSLEWQPQESEAIRAWSRVSGEDACGTQAAFFTSVDSPGYVELCPTACTMMRTAILGVTRFREACAP